MRDYHHRLGLPHSPDLHALRRAYRELARRVRSEPSGPDHGTTDRLASVHHACEVLSDPAPQGAGVARSWVGSGRERAFVDEVDIDFPSVTSLVDRMRRSYFGAAAHPPLAADVRLTSAQADTGVAVPFDVSLRHTCPACGGRGEVWLDACGACGGRGTGLLPHRLQLVVPPGVQHGTRLRFDVTPPYAPAASLLVRISVE